MYNSSQLRSVDGKRNLGQRNSLRRPFVCSLSLSLCLCSVVLTPANAVDDLAAIAPLVQTYCVRCHGPEKQKGEVRLDRLTELDAATFETVYEQVAGGLMPPDNQRQPATAERAMLVQHVLELAKKGTAVTSPGLRRLNKREYGNTVRDLLGLRKGIFDPSEYIYDDEIDEGFDTSADSLVISNELLLEYMERRKRVCATLCSRARRQDQNRKSLTSTSRKWRAEVVDDTSITTKITSSADPAAKAWFTTASRLARCRFLDDTRSRSRQPESIGITIRSVSLRKRAR